MTLVSSALSHYDMAVMRASGRAPEAALLFFTRVTLAGIFWRSGQTKVEPGSWLNVSDTTYELFATEYSGVPLPPELAANLANAAEHILPALLVLGLFTRLSALGLLAMTLTIQIFVYPDAWWPAHSLWAALALTLILKGGGMISIDRLLSRHRGT